MTKNIIFIDSRVSSYPSFIDRLAEPAEVLVLDGESDGLEQMAQWLRGRNSIDAIHVISHGSPGALWLGGTVLDGSRLGLYYPELAAMGSALTQTGDILLYGCNVAQGDLGKAFVDRWAELSGADVAASIGLTGSAALGGDWWLERTTGEVEAWPLAPEDYPFILPAESELNDAPGSADIMTLGSSMTGNLSSNSDLDYYAITVASAGVLDLMFDPPDDIGGGSFTIMLEDDQGTRLGSFVNFLDPQVFSFGVRQAGIVFASVRKSFGTSGEGSGQYSLSARHGMAGFETEGNDTRAAADLISLDQTLFAQRASALDVDYFAIPLDRAGTLTLSFGATGYPYDGWYRIELEDSSGTAVAEFSGVNSEAMSVSLAQAGIYYARVSSYDWGRYDASYRFTAAYDRSELGPDEIHGSAANDALRGAAGNDKIYGDAGFDALYGGAGNDTLDGGAGLDFLQGQAGDDTYVLSVDSPMGQIDSVTEQPFEGTDTVLVAESSGLLPDHVEILIYTGTASFFGRGNAMANTITGGNGNDSLDGGADSDTLIGAGGDDTFYVDMQSDLVLERAGEGLDTVVASAHLSLYDNVENLNLADTGNVTSGVGNALANTISGNRHNDTLWGLAGNDTIYGNFGSDILSGDSGEDALHGEGENDTLHGGDGNDSLYGDMGDDALQGDAGDDTLDGADGNDTLSGGSGLDLLIGGQGDDTYIINSLDFDMSDTGGNDTVILGASFVKLPSELENVTYANGALALPYWIDALLPDQASGRFLSLLGPSHTMGYAYPMSLPGYDTSAEDAYQFSGFNTAQKNYSKQALNYIGSVVNLVFVEVSDPATANTISFGNNAQGSSAAYASYPSRSFRGSDVFLDNATPGNLAPADGDFAALTLIHELGHALGLEHPFPGTSDAPYLTGVEDSTRWTVMSYTDDPAQYQLSYSPLDIAALQYLYGVSPGARVGDDTYSVDPSSANFIWDGAGLDCLDASGLAQSVTLYLEPGYWGFIGSKAATITAAAQVTVNFGTVIENLAGGSGNDFLSGSAAANRISGGLGADTLTGGQGDDTLDGANGVDIANYSIKAAAYTVTRDDSSGNASISGPDGSDALTSIERLSFLDANLGLDLDRSAGQVYRLYKAAFARTPDLAGLGGWIKAVDDGMSLEQVAATFATSGEFQSLYGSHASNEQFVMLLYLNALGRAPEAGGVSGWASQIASGAVTRAQLLAQFSESPENKSAVKSIIANGILFATAEQAAGPGLGQNFTGGSGADSLLGSVGNDSFTGGLGNDSLNGGAGLDQAFYSGNRASYSLSSNATSLTVAGGSDGSDTLSQVERIRFVDQALAFDTEGNAGQTYRLYQAAFERTPDTQGLSDWMRGMDGGMTLAQVATGFIASAEFKGLYGASPSDQAFVTLLYQNVLNRAPDAGGQAYWLDELGRGLTREMALIGFSESSENKAALIGVMENGIVYTPG